jgi:hypothetical protein
MKLDWLHPWQSVDDWTPGQRKQTETQLNVEVGSMHPLYKTPVRLIGVRCDCDDTLFQLNDGTGRFAVVHLTFRPSQEPMPWPETQLYVSIEDFIDARMRPDHEEFLIE